jgi:hypothetical protein
MSRRAHLGPAARDRLRRLAPQSRERDHYRSRLSGTLAERGCAPRTMSTVRVIDRTSSICSEAVRLPAWIAVGIADGPGRGSRSGRLGRQLAARRIRGFVPLPRATARGWWGAIDSPHRSLWAGPGRDHREPSLDIPARTWASTLQQ